MLADSGQILETNPAVYWRLSDTSGTTAYDSSGNSLPGTYAGGITLGQTSPVTTETNNAVTFNGSTGTVNRSVVSTATSGVAIEAWFYWNGSNSSQQIVAYNGTPGTNGYGIAISNGSCGVGTAITLILGGVSCNAVSGGSVTTHQWYFVVASRSTAGTWTLYVNSSSKGTSTATPLTPTGSTSVSPTSYPYNGKITEFALYNTGIAQTIVQEHEDRAVTTSTNTTNFLLNDLFETDNTSTITATVVDGPAGYLARYAGPPTSATSVNYLYYDSHGNLAAQANSSGTRLAAYTIDPFGASTQSSLPGNAMTPRFVGAWAKQTDSSSALIQMGVRPYDPSVGRFLSIDPIDGGSLNNYDYAGQDPVNSFDLDGTRAGGCDPAECDESLGNGSPQEDQEEAEAKNGGFFANAGARIRSGASRVTNAWNGSSVMQARAQAQGRIQAANAANSQSAGLPTKAKLLYIGSHVLYPEIRNLGGLFLRALFKALRG